MVVCIADNRLVEVYGETQSVRKTGLRLGMSHETARVRLKRLGKINKQVRYSCNYDYFSQDTAEVFYWAGFIAADGCVKLHSKKYKCLNIGLSQKDHAHLEKFTKAIGFTGPIRKMTSERYYSSTVCILSAQLFDDLARFNIVQRKSLIYTFPKWLIGHPLVNHFMRGYNDGDGSFYKSIPSGSRTVIQLHISIRGTKDFLTNYKHILESNCKLRKSNNKPRINCGIHMLEYGGTRAVGRIRDFLYKDSTESIRLDRKYNLAYDDVFINIPENYKLKPVIGKSIETGDELQFDSINDAGKNGFSIVSISNCCRGNQKYHKGYVWCFAGDTIPSTDVKVARNEINKKWTPKEIKYLVENYLTKDVGDIAKFMGRSEKAVSKKAIKLGFNKRPRWSEQEISYLTNNYLEKPIKDIAIRLNKKENSIIKKAANLGLSKRNI